jgi:glycosyltransferase involved in cell wall biosynthesis
MKENPPCAPTVGYVIKMFPRLSETFILNEVLELERQGLALHIFSLKRPSEEVFHAQALRVRSPITYLPESLHASPMRIAQGQHHACLRYGKAWRRGLTNALRRLHQDKKIGGLLGFFQACCLTREMRGVRHLHAHYANVPARIALLVRRMCGVSYSITTHAKDIFQNDPFQSQRLQERLCQAQFVVANSRFSEEHILSHLDCQADVCTIYNGLDLDCFPVRKTDPNGVTILSVGRLVEKKGFGDLIKACGLLRQRGITFDCELVGTGRLSNTLKDQIREQGVGDRVRMVGPLPQQELRARYERATLFALACVEAGDGDRDILPNVIKEAMAVGVPVVTTRLEGIEELLQDGISGLLVAPGDANALAAKIETLLVDGRLRERLAARGRKVIEDFFDRRTNVAELKARLMAAVSEKIPETPELPGGEQRVYDASCLR